MAEHRTSNLKISGERVPEVEKLQNGRYRLEFRCTGFSREDWFSENAEGSIFASLGSLMNSEMEIDGLGGSESLEGEAYDNMRLIENRLEYTPSGNLIVYFRYETLGDTFANEVDDVVDYTTSGLRRVTRVLIAKADTSYSKEVGVDSISHSVGAGGTLTLPLAGYRIEDNNAYRRVTETWVEKGILAVSTPLVGGQQTVEVQAIGLTETEVGTLLSEVTASHVLISKSTSDYDGLNTIRYTFEVDDFNVLSASENGLSQLTRTELATSAFTRATVGTATYSSLILSGEEIDNGNTIKKRVSRWAEAGILDVSMGQMDGLLVVTFTSQGTPFTPTATTVALTSGSFDEATAFIGGTAAPLFRRRTRNVNGFRQYVRSVLLNKDGSVLETGDEVVSKQDWMDYEYPGYIDLSSTKGIEAYSGAIRSIKVSVSEKMLTTSTVDATAIYRITSGAYAEISFTPTATGISQLISKAFGPRYLGGSTLSVSGGTFLGQPVTALAGTAISTPTYANWLAKSGVRIAYEHKPAFVTDEGVQWYRERIVTLVGTFDNYKTSE
jgi:hypothetical protein